MLRFRWITFDRFKVVNLSRFYRVNFIRPYWVNFTVFSNRTKIYIKSNSVELNCIVFIKVKEKGPKKMRRFPLTTTSDRLKTRGYIIALST